MYCKKKSLYIQTAVLLHTLMLKHRYTPFSLSPIPTTFLFLHVIAPPAPPIPFYLALICFLPFSFEFQRRRSASPSASKV